MINSFKFLQTQQKQRLFQFEITTNIMRNGNVSWTREYSDAVRKWISDLYFLDLYHDPFYHITYNQSIDRTLELMTTPRIVERQNNCSLFSVRVKIWGTPSMWMIAELSYPIEHIIYR